MGGLVVGGLVLGVSAVAVGGGIGRDWSVWEGLGTLSVW